MGNFFLGFPVARAKIADMISATAPPSSHASQHEKDGADEIDITDLPGGGGISDLYSDDNLFFQTFFQSLDNSKNVETGSGTISLSDGRVRMEAGGAINDAAEIYRDLDYLAPAPTWSKTRKFKARLLMYADADCLEELWIITGRRGTYKHFGFRVASGILYGTCSNQVSRSEVALETLGAGYYSEERVLEAVFTPGSKVEFYVDGSLIDELTTTLPTGAVSAERLISLYMFEGANSKYCELAISQFKLYQAE